MRLNEPAPGAGRVEGDSGIGEGEKRSQFMSLNFQNRALSENILYIMHYHTLPPTQVAEHALSSEV